MLLRKLLIFDRGSVALSQAPTDKDCESRLARPGTIEVYCKVYLSAVLERRHIASALHEKPNPLNYPNYLMSNVGRYEKCYYGAVTEGRLHEVMTGEAFEGFRVRHFTTAIGEVAGVLLRDRLPTFPTKKHDLFPVLAYPMYEEDRTERLRKEGYWSSYECLRPERGGKPIRHKARSGVEYGRLWAI